MGSDKTICPVGSAVDVPSGICVALVNGIAKVANEAKTSSGASPAGPVAPVGAMLKGKWL